ncbi:peptide chain release factor N(5)-glutamine methyltransferase [Synechococcus sp. PCC 7336]|uniref:peptide chain release factor N(5)-glutamine methyltransferase n=1 Tax=Synechococcus sp. PCC 7336 TaxID=195250 RepID=UPI00034A84D4|nr:peptide chain release factor N(5)-glutamine methyltransferase [Synechococcus sp. PCC 7336]
MRAEIDILCKSQMYEAMADRLLQWRQQARQQATKTSVATGEVDLLLQAYCGWTSLDRALGRPPTQPVDWGKLTHLWEQRWRDRIPLQYLCGSVGWRQLKLQVTPDVLIPRPETELLVDVAANWLHDRPAGLWADLGTGSGAIAIGLACEVPDVRLLAVDLSHGALQVARANIERYQLSDRIAILQGSWFEPLAPNAQLLQGILSNPPYIPTAEIEQLQPEVRDREPRLALDGGENGLKAIEHLVERAPGYLQPGGFWAIEVMQGQSAAVVERLQRSQRYTAIQVHCDLEGVERAVSAQVR